MPIFSVPLKYTYDIKEGGLYEGMKRGCMKYIEVEGHVLIIGLASII